MINKVVPLSVAFVAVAVVCIILAQRFCKKVGYGALAAVLIALGAYLLFSTDTLIEISKQFIRWFALAVFVSLACLFLLSPRFYENWKGRHGCNHE